MKAFAMCYFFLQMAVDVDSSRSAVAVCCAQFQTHTQAYLKGHKLTQNENFPVEALVHTLYASALGNFYLRIGPHDTSFVCSPDAYFIDQHHL